MGSVSNEVEEEKVCLLLPRIEYLGHGISSKGLEPLASKMAAIVNAPSPRNVTELRSLLGLVNYYRKVLPDVATVLTPLHHLLKREICRSGGMSNRKLWPR